MRFYLSLADSCRFASRNQLGIYFSSTAISSNNNLFLPYTPQIRVSPTEYFTEKEEWVRFKFEYKASGGEEYMTVGNFNDTTLLDTIYVGGGDSSDLDNLSTYYYLDDFYLGHCDSLPEDTSIGLKENILESQISVYPNPFENRVVVRYNGNEKLQFQLYNLFGQLVETASYLEVTSKNYELSLGHLPKGLYFLEIVAGENRISSKIIKE